MITITDNFDLKPHNTFGLNSSCTRWVEYTSEGDLPEIFNRFGARRVKSVGSGSNLLLNPHIDATMLHSRILDMEVIGGTLRVGAGVVLDALVAETVRLGLWGIENLSGIPGEVGAAAVQNVGAYGVELCDVITSVEAYDTITGEMTEISVGDCEYGYRRSRFKSGVDKDRYVVTHVNILLSSNPKPKIGYGALASMFDGSGVAQQEIRNAVIGLRDSKLPDPVQYGNAGSFFMNPVVSESLYAGLCAMSADSAVPRYQADGGVKVPAAWLIDKAGWRGRRYGGAMVWHKQPLVLVNESGTATVDDIIGLRDAIIADVDSKFGIRLHPEVEHLI